MSAAHRIEITRTALPSGKHEYRVNGEIHTAKSGRLYTAASVYERLTSDEALGRKAGDLIVFLHARADLALKGSPDANRIVQNGAWRRVPGTFEVQA